MFNRKGMWHEEKVDKSRTYHLQGPIEGRTCPQTNANSRKTEECDSAFERKKFRKNKVESTQHNYRETENVIVSPGDHFWNHPLVAIFLVSLADHQSQ